MLKEYLVVSFVHKNWKSQRRNVAVVGAPVLAVSAYKHYKYKKKKDDDSTEK